MTYDQKVIVLGLTLVATSAGRNWVPTDFRLMMDLLWVLTLVTLGWVAFRRLAPPIPLRTWRRMYKAGYRWSLYSFAQSRGLPTWRTNYIEQREGRWVPIGWRELGTDAYPWEPQITFACPWAAHCFAEVEQWGSL